MVLGEITVGRHDPSLAARDGFWLHKRGLLPSAVWHYQRWHGRPWYRRNVAGAPSVALA